MRKGVLIVAPPWQTGLMLIGMLAIFVAICAIVAMAATSGGSNVGSIPLGISITITGLLGAFWIKSQRQQWLRLARLMLDDGVVAGTSSDDVLSRTVTYTHRREQSQVTERMENGGTHNVERTVAWTDCRATTSAAHTARMLDASGQELVIATPDAIWFAPVRFEPSTTTALTKASINKGDSLLVLGRPKDGVFRATGPESLVVFGARGDARATLRQMVRTWYGLWLLVVALSVLATVLPFTVWW